MSVATWAVFVSMLNHEPDGTVATDCDGDAWTKTSAGWICPPLGVEETSPETVACYGPFTMTTK